MKKQEGKTHTSGGEKLLFMSKEGGSQLRYYQTASMVLGEKSHADPSKKLILPRKVPDFRGDIVISESCAHQAGPNS